MKKALHNITIRAREIRKTLRAMLPPNDKWKSDIGAFLYHTMEIYHTKHSRAKYRYGVEIEMEFKQIPPTLLHPTAIVVRNIMRAALGDGTFSVQADASLEQGFEVVTAPLSLNKLKLLEDLYGDEDVMRCLDKYAKTSGLHITVDPFSERLKERKFFDYFNDKQRMEDLRDVIGRGPNSYCWYRQVGSTLNPIKDHNFIVHLRSNRALEVRVFKSPASWGEFWQRLMLVHTVDKLVRETDLSISEIHKKVMEGTKKWLT